MLTASWKRQNLMTSIRNQYGVLILCREATISSDNGPLILPHPPLGATLSQHWLNRKSLPWCHDTAFIIPAVLYCREGMESPADAMTNKFSHNTILVLVCYTMNHLKATAGVS